MKSQMQGSCWCLGCGVSRVKCVAWNIDVVCVGSSCNCCCSRCCSRCCCRGFIATATSVYATYWLESWRRMRLFCMLRIWCWIAGKWCGRSMLTWIRWFWSWTCHGTHGLSSSGEVQGMKRRQFEVLVRRSQKDVTLQSTLAFFDSKPQCPSRANTCSF